MLEVSSVMSCATGEIQISADEFRIQGKRAEINGKFSYNKNFKNGVLCYRRYGCNQIELSLGAIVAE